MTNRVPISSCSVNGKSTVFYVDNKNFIKTLTAKQEAEKLSDEGRERYEDSLLKVGGNNVQTTTKDFAALSYLLSTGPTRSRLYFADQNGVLKGLERDGSNDWNWSDIGNLNRQVIPGTPITALLSPESDAVKVYYFDQAFQGNTPSVVWSTSSGWCTSESSI